MKHPFSPYIIENSKNMIIGTLPPEGIDFYYSNSPNTRMWDLLKSIQEKTNDIPKRSYVLPISEKQTILSNLNLSMADIIYEYERKNKSTKDKDIIPIKYCDIRQLIENTSIINLLFVYKSAAKWFLSSLENNTIEKPAIDNNKYGIFNRFELNNRLINCVLLPNPLNRGTKGYTLAKKKEIYKRWILTEN